MRFPTAKAWSPAWAGALFVAINIGFIGVYPLVSGDEAIGNDAAAEWVLHGVIRSSLFADRPGFGHGYFLQPPGQLLTGAGTYRLFGFGLWQTRLAALAWAACAVAALGLLAEKWCASRRAGWIAALLFALNPQFGETVGQARMDGQALCLLALGCLVFTRSRADGGSRRTLLFWAGLLVGLAGITHAVSAFWAAGLGVVLVGACRNRWRAGLADLAVFGAAAALPTAAWLAVGAAHPDEFRAQFLAHARAKVGGPGLPGQIRLEAVRWITKSYAHTPLLLAAFLGGALWWPWAAGIDRATRMTVIALTGIVAAATTVLLTKDSGPFNLYPAALLTILAGGWIDRVEAAAPRLPSWMRWGARAGAALLALNLAAKFALPRLVAVTVQREARDYAPIAEAIRRRVPAGAVVCGYPISWYAVEAAGASLRIGSGPDIRRHDFVICGPDDPMRAPPGFVLLDEFGKELPRFMGRLFAPGWSYHMLLYGRPPGPGTR